MTEWRLRISLLVWPLLFSASAFAANVTPSTIDSGGKRVASASYTMDGSLGGIGGISSAGSDTAKHGYIGQLTDVASLSVTSTPTAVNEGASSQLTGKATMDDNTITALTGSDVSWNSTGIPYPLSAISTTGVATATNVYQNTSTTVNGFYFGATTNMTLLVLDNIPDNYGSYAGDGIADSWQNQYFGLNNPNAAPTKDVDGTGQNNLFKYTAGLDPTNPASVFTLKIAVVNGQPAQKNLIFNPVAGGRTYTVESRTNLVSGAYTNLIGFSGPSTNGNQVTVTDLNAVETQKFYHVRISLP